MKAHYRVTHHNSTSLFYVHACINPKKRKGRKIQSLTTKPQINKNNMAGAKVTDILFSFTSFIY